MYVVPTSKPGKGSVRCCTVKYSQQSARPGLGEHPPGDDDHKGRVSVKSVMVQLSTHNRARPGEQRRT